MCSDEEMIANTKRWLQIQIWWHLERLGSDQVIKIHIAHWIELESTIIYGYLASGYVSVLYRVVVETILSLILLWIHLNKSKYSYCTFDIEERVN